MPVLILSAHPRCCGAVYGFAHSHHDHSPARVRKTESLGALEVAKDVLRGSDDGVGRAGHTAAEHADGVGDVRAGVGGSAEHSADEVLVVGEFGRGEGGGLGVARVDCVDDVWSEMAVEGKHGVLG